MRMVYKSVKIGEVYLLKTLLENHDIDVTVKNEDLHSLGARGAGLSGSFLELWVKEEDYALAEEILQKHLESEASKEIDAWQCNRCGEVIEGQFSVCWKCGNSR